MRLEQLNYFEVLVQEGSFTKAAIQLHITQPTLTASIKAMEKELNKTLLIRDTRNITLTEDGKKVLACAKEIGSRYQALLNELSPQTATVSGSMTIQAPKFVCELIIEPLNQALHTLYPHLKVRILQNDTFTPEHAITATHQVGIVSRLFAEYPDHSNAHIIPSDEVFYDSRYQYIPLFKDRLGFCVAKSSTLASKASVYGSDINYKQYPATLFPIGNIVLTDEVILSSSNPQLHVEAMLKENAHCVLPYFVYQNLFAQEQAITYRTFANNLEVTYYLIYPTEHTLTEAERFFIDQLHAYLAETSFK